MLHSISDLTTFCRKTTGDVPAKLVGASTTVVGSKMYLFGGRLVAERRMVSDLYAFDLETFVWEKVSPHPEDDVPRARYFHSADAWNNQLIIFGGMSNKVDSSNPEDLCVLNDVRFFDLFTQRWLPGSHSNGIMSDPVSDSLIPRARYAHLSSTTADRLFIIGGQDFFNVWLDDVCVYDLLGKAWIQRREYPRHCGTYRSVAVSASLRVRLPQEEGPSSFDIGTSGSRLREDQEKSPSEITSPDSLVHLPYSTAPTDDHPSDIYLYSNYNFTDVKRELEAFSPLPDTDFTIHDRSSAMQGTSFPPGLRFPTGAILGTHFIIAGTYLAHTYQSFSIWALDLVAMTWSRIDPGSAVATGSWFRGCLWAEANKFLVFGNRNGSLVDDYNRRLLSWDHVAVVDLEAFGIYQPPALQIDIPMQDLGLAAFEEGALTDFSIICDDGRKVNCSRRILEVRWPWFKQQRQRFMQAAMSTLESLPTSAYAPPLPQLPGVADPTEGRVDPRLTPRSFNLSEPYPVTLALIQYFYAFALITPLQHAPAVLSQLLVLSTTYEITHLESLVKHAMHRALSNSTSVGVYEVATLCSCRSLQIRALKTVMSYSQKRPSRGTRDKDNGGNDRSEQNGGSSNGHGSGRSNNGSDTITRPRGTSDASHWHQNNSSGGTVRALNPHSENRSPIEGSYSSPRIRSKNHYHRTSTVSFSTEHELHAVAELMSAVSITEVDETDDEGDADPILGEPVSFHRMLQPDSDGTAPLYIDPSKIVADAKYDYQSDSDNSYFSTSPSSLHPDGSSYFSRPKLGRLHTHSDYTSRAGRSGPPSLTHSASYSSLGSSNRSYVNTALPETPVSASPRLAHRDHVAVARDPSSYTDVDSYYRPVSSTSISPPDYSTYPIEKPPITIITRSSEKLQSPSVTSPGALSRFLSKKSKIASPSTPGFGTSGMDAKAIKALEKERKKAEAKARSEALAADLKQRARDRAAADKSSIHSAERKKAEFASMYGDGALTM